MDLIILNRCINQESKYYGLKSFGLITGLLLMVLVWMKSSIIFGMLGAGLGYFIGDMLSKHWHQGKIQKLLYWHFSIVFCYSRCKLPKPFDRKYI